MTSPLRIRPFGPADAEALAPAAFATLDPLGRLVPFTHLHQIYVAGDARREGIAERLLASVADTARRRGMTRIAWTTATDNAAARALHDSMGAAGADKRHYALEGAALEALARRS